MKGGLLCKILCSGSLFLIVSCGSPVKEQDTSGSDSTAITVDTTAAATDSSAPSSPPPPPPPPPAPKPKASRSAIADSSRKTEYNKAKRD